MGQGFFWESNRSFNSVLDRIHLALVRSPFCFNSFDLGILLLPGSKRPWGNGGRQHYKCNNKIQGAVFHGWLLPSVIEELGVGSPRRRTVRGKKTVSQV